MIEVKYDIGQEVCIVNDNRLVKGRVYSVNVTTNKSIGHVYTVVNGTGTYCRRECDVYENTIDYCYEILERDGYKDFRIVKKDEVK